MSNKNHNTSKNFPPSPSVRPQFTVEELREQFKVYSREPFIEVLSFMMRCAPDQKSMEAFAREYPDRWASAIRTFSRLAGYHDKLDISHNIAVDISQMGDAQLLQKLEEVRAQLAALPAQSAQVPMIEAEPMESIDQDGDSSVD